MTGATVAARTRNRTVHISQISSIKY